MNREASAKVPQGALEFQLSLLNLMSAGAKVHPQVEELQELMSATGQILIAVPKTHVPAADRPAHRKPPNGR